MIPFRKVRELTVSVMNLLEAEGRALKGVVIRVAAAVVGLIVAAAVALGGLWMLGLALFEGFEPQVGAAWAWCIAGLVYIIAAGVIAWGMLKLAHR